MYYKYCRYFYYVFVSLVLFLMSSGVIFLEIFYLSNSYGMENFFKYIIHIKSPFCLILLIYPILGFLTLCSYFFIFKMNLLNIYGLRLGNKTNVVALQNSSYLFTYFTFPISINFYNMFLNKKNTSFVEALGEKIYI